MNITDQQIINEIIQSEELDIKDLICDPTLIFDDLHVLQKTTKSDTIQMLVEIKKQSPYLTLLEFMKRRHTGQVFVKISFENPADNSDLVERTIYKYLFRLYFQKRTPNIMRYVASFKCDNFFDFLLAEYQKYYGDPKFQLYSTLIKRLLKIKYSNSDIDVNEATFLVVERGNGKELQELLTAKALNEKEFLEIMFQLFYTMREMNIHKVRHNDLHLKNIWINIHKKPLRIIYFVSDDDYVVLNTKHVVKVYDFDRSTFTMGPLKNKALEDQLCPNYGMCSNDNPYFDPHTVAYILYNFFRPLDYAANFAKEVVRNPKYLDPSCCRFPSRMCDLQEVTYGNYQCSKNFVPAKGDIYAFDELYYETSVFDSLKKSLSKDGYKEMDIPIDHFLPIDANPWLEFKKHVFVASVCKQLPVGIANFLLLQYGDGLSRRQ